MKWSIWVEPNKIIEEEFPDGWSRDEVFEAASNRYANKVTTVSPAPIGASDTSNSSSSSNNSGSDISLSGILALIVFFGGAWVLVNYWPYVITIGVIGMIIWIIKIFNE
jgi:hypothetical protein